MIQERLLEGTGEKKPQTPASRVEQIVTPFLDSIILGDNCDLLRQMPNGCVDLVVTSPPYDDLRTYGGHSWDFYGVAWNLKRVLKLGGVIVWVVNDQVKDGSETGSSMEQALHFKRLGLNLHDTMIYHAVKPPTNDNRYQQSFEYMFVFSKGAPARCNLLIDKKNNWAGTKNFGVRTQRDADGTLKEGKQTTVPEFSRRLNIWEYATGKGYSAEDECAFDHPAIFPEKLAADNIASWSNEGDTVLDPFSGSGTTCKMAKKLGRHWIGFEVNEVYVEISKKRLAQEMLW